jgi:hypothetical protein
MVSDLGQFMIAARHAGPKALDLDALADRAMELGVAAVAAMAAAAAVASIVHILRLTWTVSLAGLPAAAVAFAFSSFLGVAVGGAFVLAAGIAYRWQREVSGRGGVEAERGRARRGLGALTIGTRTRRRWVNDRVRDGRLALGQSRGGDVVTVPFGEREGVRAFIPGAPGSGKTVNLAVHASAYAAQGQAALAIDPKGDPALRTVLERAAHSNGRRFVEWSPTGDTIYNPLARGNPSEITDKALAGETWSEPHYLRQAQRYINLELQTLHAAGKWPASLRGVVDYLDVNRLDELCDQVGGELGERTVRYLDSLSTRQKADLSGVRDRLAVLAESELGAQLDPTAGGRELDLLAALRARDVVYFSLDSDRYALASQMLGAAIVSDLVSLTGELQGQPLRALVVIDEFAAVAADEVARLLSRSRSAGLSVVLATQAFADLSIARPGDGSDSLRRQVLSHIDYVVAHRQSEPEAAELLGQMAGTKPAWATSVSLQKEPFFRQSAFDFGRQTHSRRRTREFVRHPDEFKRLRRGEAIVIEPSGRERADLVQVWPVTGSPIDDAGPIDAQRAVLSGSVK